MQTITFYTKERTNGSLLIIIHTKKSSFMYRTNIFIDCFVLLLLVLPTLLTYVYLGIHTWDMIERLSIRLVVDVFLLLTFPYDEVGTQENAL